MLQELETASALGLSIMKEQKRQVVNRMSRRLSPDAKLTLLAVGVNRYSSINQPSLRLKFARQDAEEIASLLTKSQDEFYAKVLPQCLTDEAATKVGLFEAFDAMKRCFNTDLADDNLAVIFIACHGVLVEGAPYLLESDSNRICNTPSS